MKLSELKKGNYRTFIKRFLFSHQDEVFSTKELTDICRDNGYEVPFNTIRNFVRGAYIERIKDENGNKWYGCPEAIKNLGKIIKERV